MNRTKRFAAFAALICAVGALWLSSCDLIDDDNSTEIVIKNTSSFTANLMGNYITEISIKRTTDGAIVYQNTNVSVGPGTPYNINVDSGTYLVKITVHSRILGVNVESGGGRYDAMCSVSNGNTKTLEYDGNSFE